MRIKSAVRNGLDPFFAAQESDHASFQAKCFLQFHPAGLPLIPPSRIKIRFFGAFLPKNTLNLFFYHVYYPFK